MSSASLDGVRARAEILEREIRALQASERAAREREIALRCELDAEKIKSNRRRSSVSNGASTTVNDDDRAYAPVESPRKAVPSPTGARGMDPARGRADEPVGGASTSDGRAMNERAVRDLHGRDGREMIVVDAASMERAVARAVERAVREAEDARSSHEAEEERRRDRADARALASARNRAGELALELREARALVKQWRERAEAAIETSDTTAAAYQRLRDAVRLPDHPGGERALISVAAEETQKLAKKLEMTQEQLKASQRVIQMRDAEHDRLAFELRKAHESIKELTTALAEAKAESEHARELTSVEYAEKQRLIDEVSYLKNEIDRLRATNDEDARAFNEWRESTQREEKERNRELQQARRDIARQAMKVRELEREMARRKDDVVDKQAHNRELSRVRRELESLRATSRELTAERDVLARQVEELANAQRARRALAGFTSESSARDAEGELGDDDQDDADDADDADDDLDDLDADAFDETTGNLVRSSVDGFFEEDDELDAQLEADRERAHALARRLQSIESRAAVLLSLRE